MSYYFIKKLFVFGKEKIEFEIVFKEKFLKEIDVCQIRKTNVVEKYDSIVKNYNNWRKTYGIMEDNSELKEWCTERNTSLVVVT